MPPGPVTLAASEPCWDNAPVLEEARAFDARRSQTFLRSHFSCFNYVKLYDFPISNTSEKLSRIVLLDGSLEEEISQRNGSIKVGRRTKT